MKASVSCGVETVSQAVGPGVVWRVLCNEAALPSKGFGDGSAHNEEAQLYSPQPTHDDWLCRYWLYV